ncbi:Putative RNA-binding protein C3H8.09c [Tolypocladium paradoxum]|uniref:RNA-binding protein C3H8.09c n=1 Tax=Tolypocladium paradoxum TaxID=94208 RepID=A0A2S4L0I7_9HYPO|nr:Putative RNA-binding protein C3H8.09c [Tolypocladium paradoxum]
MTEPEAEVQATANVSPVSPSPVYTAAPLVVPALQDTVDTIDAMVAAAASVAAPNGVDEPMLDPALIGDGAAGGDDNNDVVDDDSFNDAYGDDNEMTVEDALQAQPEPSDSNDDYAKTFDSPIDPQEGDGQDFQQLVSEPMPPESNQVSLPSDHLSTNGPSDAAVAHDPSTAFDDAPAATADLSAAQSGAQPDPVASSTEASQQPPEPQQHPGLASSVASSEPTAKPDSTNPESQDPSLDIQRLVADLTAQPAESSSDPEPSGTAMAEPPTGSTSLIPSTALPSSSSLPPRPPLPHSASQSYASQHHPAGPSSNASVSSGGVMPPTPGQPSTYGAVGAPGTSTEAVSTLPPPPAVSALNVPPYQAQTAPGYSTEAPPDAEYQRHWAQFMADERQYMSDAKWDRFPEGSRIFIGNLSSDKVSKRDVFDVFHKYGRLAQISLKSAYGFVQYHTVDEGRMAMENLQGIEIKGRRIHLEISRVQDKSKKERARSPDRGRGRDGGRRYEKHQGRDDYRPGRNHSPRRNDFNSRDDGFGRDRGFHNSGRGGRGRSRSPAYGRNDRDSYRRRSPSPYGRSRQQPELDLPRRYGADVPDVQIILQPEVNRDFVTWVEGAFKAKALKTEVMFLHPRFPKDQVIQRQAAEGVHGVVDLDLRAQSLGRIPVQAFDRSGGTNNVRFDQYVDLDPGTAAEVILRAKASGPAASYGQGYAAAGGYSNPYGAQHQQVPPHGASYPGVQHPGPYPPQQQRQQQQHAPPAAADIASLMGHVDNATLQRLLSSIQGAPQAQGGSPGTPGGYGAPAPVGNPQVDIQAILGSLGGSAPGQQHASPQGQYGAAYGAQQPAAPNGGAKGGGDAAAQVQNIMAQLARYRQ